MELTRLPIKMDELIEAMKDSGRRESYEWYLDKETGEIFVVELEILSALEGGEEFDDFHRWDHDGVVIAQRVAQDPGRYEPVPQAQPQFGMQIMSEFIASVKDAELRQKLRVAIDGKGASKRFRHTLSDHPEVRQQWLSFERARWYEVAKSWLEELGIEAAEGN